MHNPIGYLKVIGLHVECVLVYFSKSYFDVLFNVGFFVVVLINLHSFGMKTSLILRAMRRTLNLLCAVCIDFSILVSVLSFIWIILCQFAFFWTHAISVCSLFFFPLCYNFRACNL